MRSVGLVSFGGDRLGDLVESDVGYGGISGCSVGRPAAALSRARFTEPEGLCFLFFGLPSPVSVSVDPRLSDSISGCTWDETEIFKSFLIDATDTDCHLRLPALLLATEAFRCQGWSLDN